MVYLLDISTDYPPINGTTMTIWMLRGTLESPFPLPWRPFLIRACGNSTMGPRSIHSLSLFQAVRLLQLLVATRYWSLGKSASRASSFRGASAQKRTLVVTLLALVPPREAHLVLWAALLERVGMEIVSLARQRVIWSPALCFASALLLLLATSTQEARLAQEFKSHLPSLRVHATLVSIATVAVAQRLGFRARMARFEGFLAPALMQTECIPLCVTVGREGLESCLLASLSAP